MNMGGATIEQLTNDTNYHSDIHPDSQMYKINPLGLTVEEERQGGLGGS